jgi:hypothetical protein
MMYAFKTMGLLQAVDRAMAQVKNICPENQGQAIETIINQLQQMPVSKEILNRYPSEEEARQAQRASKKDPYYPLRDFRDSCYRNLNYVLPRDIINTKIPFARTPELSNDNLESESAPYHCDQELYSDCYVLLLTKVEAGQILTKQYTYNFSAGALDLRRRIGSKDFEKELEEEAFDENHPYPLIPPKKIRLIKMGAKEVNDCADRSTFLGGLELNDDFLVQEKTNPYSYETVDNPIVRREASFKITGHMDVLGGYMDTDSACAHAKHKE